MSSVNSILSADVRNALMNRCLTKSALAINAAAAATVKTTGPTTYTVNGIQYSKASLAAQAITPTHDAYGNPVASGIAAYVQPNLTTVFYVVSVNAAGTVAVSQGSYAGQPQPFPSDLSRVNIGNGLIPVEPAGYTAIGVLKVATSGGATFTPGTTALDAANVAVTYADVDVLPTSF